jgi:single-stranded-DNA-specific exonuclease
MSRIWKLIEIPAPELEAFQAKTGFPSLLARILLNRGIAQPEEIERYFDPRSRWTGSPFLLDGMSQAIDRLLRAVDRDEAIRVYGDRDVDGITATVVLLETLQRLTPKADFTVPVIEDGYGLNPDYLQTAHRDGVSLIITVDCGISNVEEVEVARSLGIDVIVTDHHEPPATLPAAHAIVDPKLPGSLYPQKNIAGVGVSFKVALALELAQSKALQRPIVALDWSDAEIEAVTFSPRGGFTPQKNLNAAALQGKILLFFDRSERDRIAEVLPAIEHALEDGRQQQVMYLQEQAGACIDEPTPIVKSDLSRHLNLTPDCQGAKRLLVAYLKFLEAREPGVKALWQRCLDILTIGTIADMVPLRGENRTFAQLGMKFTGTTRRVGLQELYTLLGWKKRNLTERDISFSIAPILNASGRLKTAELAINLLATDQPARAQALARELFDLNIERKRLAEESYRMVKEHLLQQNDLDRDKVLLVVVPMSNQGVTGIVATRLMLDYCRPVLVLLEDHGKLLGSARSFKDINVIQLLNACSHLLEKFGGHIGAAGLTVLPENVEVFRGCLRAAADRLLRPEDLQAEWSIDAEITLDQVNESFLADLQRFAPFGIENPPPLFLARQVPFYEIRKVGDGKNHLRFKMRNSSGRFVFGIGFNLGGLMEPDLLANGMCDVVFTVEPNEFNGVRSAQMVVCDAVLPGATDAVIAQTRLVRPQTGEGDLDESIETPGA